ncbi:hypothetical protein QAD02_004537 [Eretmocerus hayati]|uniref:Uncharacterized protein n=1 Tax=Eretmocerus hayati TaxID=131215 RepID=A0ACC2NUP0_9HYME|nr:hypothetical protein QAD02_004537 [Eretmocerus hayati]
MALLPTPESVLEQQVLVDGNTINYIKVGVGEHPVLLLPGSIGTAWIYFKPQIELLDRAKFTIIAWDPPGCRKSRPPDRSFSRGFHLKDALLAKKLMDILNHPKYSLVGWCAGGRTAIIMAAKFPQNIRKLVLSGTNAWIESSSIEIYQRLQNINGWPESMRSPVIACYGEGYFQRLCNGLLEAMKEAIDTDGGDFCKAHVSKIQCPTLIFHEEFNAVVESFLSA